MKLKKIANYRPLRRMIICVAIMLILILSLEQVLRWHLSEPKLKTEITQLLAPTGRTIQFGKGITVSIFPHPTIELNTIQISEPNQPTKKILEIKKLELEFSWLDLLKENPKPNQLIFDNANINVIRKTNGNLSIDDLLTLTNKNSTVVPDLKKLHFKNTNIFIQDQIIKANFTLDNVNFFAKNYHTKHGRLDFQGTLSTNDKKINFSANSAVSKMGQAFSLNDFSFQADTKIIPYGQVNLAIKGQLIYEPKIHRIVAKKINTTTVLENPQLSLTATGEDWTIYPNYASFPTIQYIASVADIHSPQIRYEFIGQMSNARFDKDMITADQSRIRTKITTTSRTLSLENISNLSYNIHSRQFLLGNMRIYSHQILNDKNALSLKGNFEGEITGILGENYQLTTSGTLDQHPMSFTLDYKKGEQLKEYQFHLALDQLNVEPMQPKAEENIKIAFFNSRQLFDLNFLADKKIEGDIDIKDFISSRLQIQNFKAILKGSPNELNIEEINASVYQGKLTGKAKLSITNNMPNLHMDQSIIGVNIQPFLANLFGYQNITGRGNGRILLNATGKTPKDMKDNLSGDISLEVRDGALGGINLVDTFQRSPSELQAQSNQNIEGNSEQKTEFSLLKGSSRLEKGIARNKDLSLHSELITLRGDGKFDLAKELIDYTMYITATPKFSRFKGVNVPLRITGDITQPTYSLNYAVMTKGKTTKEEKQKALKEELMKQISGIIK